MRGKKKIGRPAIPKKEYRGDVFSVRLKSDEANKVRDAIQNSNAKPSDWIRAALVEKAEKNEGSKRGMPRPPS